MNPLQELLDASDGQVSLTAVREATAAALHAMRHDRRLEPLDLRMTEELTDRLYHTPDIRTFELRTGDYTGSERDHYLAQAALYVHQMLIELIDAASLQNSNLREIQCALAARGGLMRLGEVPFRMHLHGRQLALVPRDFDDNKGGAIAVREPSLLRSLSLDPWRG